MGEMFWANEITHSPASCIESLPCGTYRKGTFVQFWRQRCYSSEWNVIEAIIDLIG
jgi:hypothetical protein